MEKIYEDEFKEMLNLDDKKFKNTIKKIFQKRIEMLGENQARDIEKRIFLQSIDLNWKSHIQYLE